MRKSKARIAALSGHIPWQPCGLRLKRSCSTSMEPWWTRRPRLNVRGEHGRRNIASIEAEPGGDKALGGPVFVGSTTRRGSNPAWRKALLVAARQQPTSHRMSIQGSSAASVSLMMCFLARRWPRGTTIRNGSLSRGRRSGRGPSPRAGWTSITARSSVPWRSVLSAWSRSATRRLISRCGSAARTLASAGGRSSAPRWRTTPGARRRFRLRSGRRVLLRPRLASRLVNTGGVAVQITMSDRPSPRCSCRLPRG